MKILFSKYTSILIICLLSFLNTSLWIFTIPFNEAPDECNHYSVSRWMQENKRLPVYFKDPGATIPDPDTCVETSYSIFPNLKYGIDAVFMEIGETLGMSVDNLYLIPRFLSNVYITLFVLISYLLATLIFKNKNQYLVKIKKLNFDLRLIIPIFLGFLPNITFIGAYANIDSFSLFVSSLLILATIKFYKSKINTKELFIYSSILSFSFYAKYNFYALYPFIGLLLLYKLKQEKWKNFLKFIAIFIPIFFAIIGWFFLRNAILYGGDFTGNQSFWALQETLVDPDYQSHADLGYNFISILYKTHWIQGNMMSYIGVFGWFNIKYPTFVYYLIYLVLAVPGSLTILSLWKNKKEILKSGLWRLAAVSFIGLWLLVILLSIYNSLYNDFQPQGRYLYPALLPSVLLVFWGVSDVIISRQKEQIIFIIISTLFMSILCAYSFLGFILVTP